MLALGCPAELADGSVFESLAAQRRSKKYVPSVMPVATNTGRDVDMYLRRAARAAGELIDADHRRRAVEIGRQITAEKN
jgi:hypothetical protein